MRRCINAIDAGLLPKECSASGGKVQELGAWLAKQRRASPADLARTEQMVTIFDSTGVAVQDVQIASMVYDALVGA